MQKIELFQLMGKLFYSVAASDKRIHADELESLKSHLNQEKIDFIDFSKSKNVDAFSQIMIEFELAQLKKLDPEVCFQLFKDFKIKNAHLFTEDIKNFIWNVCNAIALSAAGYNKSELVKLSQIKLLLKD